LIVSQYIIIKIYYNYLKKFNFLKLVTAHHVKMVAVVRSMVETIIANAQTVQVVKTVKSRA